MSSDDTDIKIRSFSGARISEITYQIEKSVADERYDGIVVHVGTNDIGRKSLDRMIEDYTTLIQTIRRQSPETQVFVSSLLPRPNEPYENDLVSEFNTRLESLAVWLAVTFINHSFIFSSEEGQVYGELFWDNVHPNKSGINLLSTNIQDYINYYLLQDFRNGRTWRC
jgi:lysophospholipase L1-like esterase